MFESKLIEIKPVIFSHINHKPFKILLNPLNHIQIFTFVLAIYEIGIGPSAITREKKKKHLGILNVDYYHLIIMLTSNSNDLVFLIFFKHRNDA